jgi:nucleotidyltransferase/DNA polymerase involved in DNA repair
MEERLRRAGIGTVAELWEASPLRLRRVWGGINGLLFHQMLHGVDIQPPSSRFAKSMGHQHALEPELRTAAARSASVCCRPACGRLEVMPRFSGSRRRGSFDPA